MLLHIEHDCLNIYFIPNDDRTHGFVTRVLDSYNIKESLVGLDVLEVMCFAL